MLLFLLKPYPAAHASSWGLASGLSAAVAAAAAGWEPCAQVPKKAAGPEEASSAEF